MIGRFKTVKNDQSRAEDVRELFTDAQLQRG
jgi:hypothetical protein